MAAQTLYLMLGYPGAGKTTVSKIICELTGAVHLWADFERRKRFNKPTHNHAENIVLYKELNALTDKLLGEGKSVVFDTNFSFYKDRERLRKIAAKHGAKTVLIWITTPREIAKERATLQSTNQHTRVFGNMPESDFERMSNNIQPPREDENVIEIEGVNATKDSVASKIPQLRAFL